MPKSSKPSAEDANPAKPTGPVAGTTPKSYREKSAAERAERANNSGAVDDFERESEDDFLPDNKSNFRMGQLNKSNEPQESKYTIPKAQPQKLRLVPRLGRTVHVSKAVDPTRAFKLLDIACSQNRLRQDANAQRYHERPGLKRKRLKMVRWQRLFFKGFKATCTRVNELRRQGW